MTMEKISCNCCWCYCDSCSDVDPLSTTQSLCGLLSGIRGKIVGLLLQVLSFISFAVASKSYAMQVKTHLNCLLDRQPLQNTLWMRLESCNLNIETTDWVINLNQM